jgi:pimeloyl-ACP methyl ester carboxylesterase
MVDHPSRINKILAVFFGCSLAGSAATGIASSARAAEAEAVTIDTSFNVYTPPVRLENPPGDAYASVVLMTGGNGLLSLDATGTIIDSTGNFLIRTANLFLQHGLNVMMADVALAYPAPNGMTLSDRLSAMHAGELQGFINAAMNRWGKPVWVVGTSNGSVSAVTAGGFTSALSGLRGVVLTSTVTQLSTADQPTFNLYVSRITVPTLVLWNQDDHCIASPPSGSAALFAAIPSSNKASDVLQGGHSVATDPCGAFSEHGYAGTARDAVKDIAQFIKQTQ